MTTTTAQPTSSADTVARRARIATVAAALWAVSPVVWFVSDVRDQPFGSLPFVAVAAAWWICMVAAPLLLVAGHLALRTSLGERAGRIGATGIATAATGLAAMGIGIGIELASMTAGGGEVALGYVIWMVGFLVAAIGALATGIAVVRQRRDGASRSAGWLLVLAVPLGIGIGLLGDLLAPQEEAVFWAMLTVPIGIAWVLLGRSLATSPTTAG
jgi:hypothetical protein